MSLSDEEKKSESEAEAATALISKLSAAELLTKQINNSEAL